MLADNADSGQETSADSELDNSEGEPRRQYTLKGVEREAIELMREAAQSNGQKIGHWVSEKLKEAALKSLEEHQRKEVYLRNLVDPNDSCERLRASENPIDDAVVHELNSRIASLELEMRDLVRQQRDIFAILLKKS